MDDKPFAILGLPLSAEQVILLEKMRAALNTHNGPDVAPVSMDIFARAVFSLGLPTLIGVVVLDLPADELREFILRSAAIALDDVRPSAESAPPAAAPHSTH